MTSDRHNHSDTKQANCQIKYRLVHFNADRPFNQRPRSPQTNQTFDSNGPNIKIRGSAHQIFERYLALAREATANDERIAAENFYQHAEHYFRIDNVRREGNQQGMPPRPTTPADVEMNAEADPKEVDVDRSQLQWDGESINRSEWSRRESPLATRDQRRARRCSEAQQRLGGYRRVRPPSGILGGLDINEFGIARAELAQ